MYRRVIDPDGLLRIQGRKVEASMERELSAWCKSKGYHWIKVHKTGWPDRVLLLPGGRVVWFELKTSTGRVRKAQKVIHQQLTKEGHTVEIPRSTDDAKRLIQAHMDAASLPD